MRDPSVYADSPLINNETEIPYQITGGNGCGHRNSNSVKYQTFTPYYSTNRKVSDEVNRYSIGCEDPTKNNGIIVNSTVFKMTEDIKGHTFYLYKEDIHYNSIRESDEKKGNVVIVKDGKQVDYIDKFSGISDYLGLIIPDKDYTGVDNSVPNPTIVAPQIIDMQIYYDTLILITENKIIIGGISDNSYSIIEHNGFVTTTYEDRYVYVMYTDGADTSKIFKYKKSIEYLTDQLFTSTVDSGFINVFNNRVEFIGVSSSNELFMAELDTTEPNQSWKGVLVTTADAYLLGGDRDDNRWNLFFEVETVVDGIHTTVISGISLTLNERPIPEPVDEKICDVTNNDTCYLIDTHTGMLTEIDCFIE